MTFDVRGEECYPPDSMPFNPPRAPGSVALTVVSPCYNEAAVLCQFYERVSSVCRRLVPDYEIILVNDGSTDDTWPILAELTSRDPHVVAVCLSRNHGHQLALTAGLHYCRG